MREDKWKVHRRRRTKKTTQKKF